MFHLPIELWNGETFDLVVSYFGKVLKVDDHTLTRS